MRSALLSIGPDRGRQPQWGQTEICNKIRLFSVYSHFVCWANSPWHAAGRHYQDLHNEPRCPYKRGVTGRVTRPITKHSYNEYQTEIPLMGEIEIPRRSFLVNKQVDVYYISFCWVLAAAQHVIMFISRQGTQKTSPEIQSQNTECQCQLNCLSDILLSNDILWELCTACIILLAEYSLLSM